MPAAQKVRAETCHFLQRLPAELRNEVYDLAFGFDPDIPVDLLHAEPPSASLIQTCRQIYSESRAMYRNAFRNYWRTTEFVMQHTVDDITGSLTLHEVDSRDYWNEWTNVRNAAEDAILHRISHLQERDLQQIKRLVLTRDSKYPEIGQSIYKCVDIRGVWRMLHPCDAPWPSVFQLKVATATEGLHPSQVSSCGVVMEYLGTAGEQGLWCFMPNTTPSVKSQIAERLC